MAEIRQRIGRGGQRPWRMEDFRDLPLAAAAQALSRLRRAGEIERITKGVYFRPDRFGYGRSRPNPAVLEALAARGRSVFPSGGSAARLLEFSTRDGPRREVATCAASLSRKLIGRDTIVHTRRPPTWEGLTATDAALLDFLRDGGRTSELPPGETIQRTLAHLAEVGESQGRKSTPWTIRAHCRFERLAAVAESEPPRIRALLGALGERLGKQAEQLERLRASLNPLSRFEFGLFAELPNARAWQAKERRRRETVEPRRPTWSVELD